MIGLAWLFTTGLFGLTGCPKKDPPPERLDGRQIFANVCARCHGTEGLGGPPTEAGPGPRRFRDAEFQRTHSDEDIVRAIRTGKGMGMPPFGNAFDDAQLKELVQVIRAYRPADDPHDG